MNRLIKKRINNSADFLLNWNKYISRLVRKFVGIFTAIESDQGNSLCESFNWIQ